MLFGLLLFALSSAQLTRESKLSPIRLHLHMIDGSFLEVHRVHLFTVLIPAVKELYSSLLQYNRLIDPLKPSTDTCNSVQVPDYHLDQGVNTDVIIYLHSNSKNDYVAFGQVCEQEKGTWKRPLIGTIGLNSTHFFNTFKDLQFQHLVREVAHVLAFDSSLFQDFLKHDGQKYAESVYSLTLNYPKRGKTVKTIAFPQMLEKARKTFDCKFEGLELEDYSESETSSPVFWDSRVVYGDILSSQLIVNAVFSDITLAVFEDSGWYFPDYSYSQQLKVGLHQGCKWVEEKCVVDYNVNLPGFCDTNETDLCDSLNLGFGSCFMSETENIPAFEQYFSNKKIAGLPVADFCPVVLPSSSNQCRSSSSVNLETGEEKGLNSRCFMNNLLIEEKSFDLAAKAKGGCFTTNFCGPSSVNINVGRLTIDCPYGGIMTVKGYQGYITCPKSNEFCLNVPCPFMCYGRGTCKNGLCSCKTGWGGMFCTNPCDPGCKSCSLESSCIDCIDGFYNENGGCFPCDPSCRTCGKTSDLCTSCNTGSELVGQKCETNCLASCASCDDPCSLCESSYFISSGKCEKCDIVCKECQNSPDNCISCYTGYSLNSASCVPDCLPGCVSCEYPCTTCLDGYFLSTPYCILCDNICATCTVSASICTSCYSGFTLQSNTCKQACKPNCLTCDSPCSKCEDGFFISFGDCKKCEFFCLTCQSSSEICTSCKSGFVLKGATCELECAENCKSCSFPCSECKEGFYEQDGLCFKCSDNCKTCEEVGSNCLACFNGFGLVGSKCRSGCMDHCLSCDSPCSNCEAGFFERNSACIRCDVSCKTCKGSGDSDCVSCADGYSFIANKCKIGCQEHCISCDEPCSLCETGYFPYVNGCSKCKTSCETCENYSKCLVCSSGYGLVGGNCEKSCKDHCVSCDSPCSVCEKGFFSNQISCEKCSDSCLTCQGSHDFCLTCPAGFDLAKNKCVKGCIENCSNCEHPCSFCLPGFTLTQGFCSPCPTGCESCSSDLVSCYSCFNGFTLQGFGCKKKCLLHCKSCDEPCSTCESGFLTVSGGCTPCQHPCQSCQTSLDRCTSCFSGYRFDDFKCVSVCIEHCKSCDDPCSVCEDGFLKYKGLCSSCSLDCRTCETDPNICTSCQAWETLKNGKCERKCLENCIDCSYPCRSCINEFELNEGKCVSCLNYLREDELKAEFIKDYSGLAVSFNRPVKNTLNSCGNYFKPETIAMIGTDSMCAWEGNSKFVVVFGSEVDFNVRTLLMHSLTTFGSNCSSIETDFEVKISLKMPGPFVSLSVPSTYTLGCNNEVLLVQAFTEEKSFSFDFKTSPRLGKLEDYLKGLEGKALSIPESLLSPTSLLVTFTATNPLTVSSKVTREIKITTDRHLSVAIDAGSRIRLKTSQSLSLHGTVQQNSCINHKDLEVVWKFMPTSAGTTEEGYFLERKADGSNQLSIPKGFLEPGESYVYRFEVKNDEKFTFSDLQIDVVNSQIIVVIDRSSGSVPVDQKLVLSAEDSYDPSDPEAVLNFQWDCQTYFSKCVDVLGNPILSETKSSSIKVSPNVLKIGSVYMFSVKVSRGDRISKESVFITGSDSDSYVQIHPVMTKVNIEEDFYVYPKYFTDKNCSFYWRNKQGPAVKTKSDKNDPYLIIEKNEMLPSKFYVFNLTVSCSDKAFFSQASWLTNGAPECDNIKTLSVGNSVSVSINCEDSDSDYPLVFIFGVVRQGRYVPLKVLHSPSTLFQLNSGNWTVYLEVCDSLQTCRKFLKSVEVKGRKLEENENSYSVQKAYPESLPLAILNNAENFNLNNFKEVFDDLVFYLKSRELDTVYLKMAIECLEIITFSNKSHFMKVYQKEITELLIHIISRLEKIDEETVDYVVNLYSAHGIKDYFTVSQLFEMFSEKFMKKMPPGSIKQVFGRISLIRHRFVGHDSLTTYSANSVNVSNLVLEGDPFKVYDALFIFYPSNPSAIVDIKYYLVGFYSNFTYTLLEKSEFLKIDIQKPFSLVFKAEPGRKYKCQQLRNSEWIDEGCNLTYRGDTVLLSSWHISSFRLSKSKNTETSLLPVIVDISIITLCIFLTSVFCIIDKSKNNYIQNLIPDTPETPKGSDLKKEDEKAFSRAKTLRQVESSTENFKPAKPAVLVYHPWLNIFYKQPGDRRSASTLQMFAVVSLELFVTGLFFNPGLGEVFDIDDKFSGFAFGQVFCLVFGFVLVQLLSVLLTYLNQVNDLNDVSKLIGMTVSVTVIVTSLGVSLLFGFTYPKKYAFSWVVFFEILALFELVVVQNLYWVLNLKVFKPREYHPTRNMRIFTTEG